MNVASIMTPNPTAIGVEASLDEAMRAMENDLLRHLPVVRDGRIIGLLSERDLLEITGWLNAQERRAIEAPSGSVGHHMKSPVVTVSPEDSLAKAVVRLTSRRIGCLPVVEGETLVGIVTESDVLEAFLRALRDGTIPDDADGPVSLYMTEDPVAVDAATDSSRAMELMRAKRFRHLPVMEGNEVVGILSERDILMAIGRGTIDDAPVREHMTEHPFTLRPDQRVSEAAEIMVDAKVGALLVTTEEEKLVGLISLTDLFGVCLESLAIV